MSFQLETGHTYWILEPDEYDTLMELMTDLKFEGNNLRNDFIAYNGKYYAILDDIDPNEQAFLTEWGLAETYLYILSNQFPGDV